MNPFEDSEVEAATEALFESTCSHCQGTIFVGDMIVLSNSEWIHEECA